jgi:hypothetical protein
MGTARPLADADHWSLNLKRIPGRPTAQSHRYSSELRGALSSHAGNHGVEFPIRVPHNFKGVRFSVFMADVGAVLLFTASPAHQDTHWYATWWVSVGAGAVAVIVTAVVPALRGVISALFRRNSGNDTVIIRSGRNRVVVDVDRAEASDIARLVEDAERKWRSDSGGPA